MASYGIPSGHGSPQYTPYRPPAQQQEQQHHGQQHQHQHQQQQQRHGYADQPFVTPHGTQSSQHVPQHQYQPLPPTQHVGSLTPAMANISIDGMAPAPLRFQRKPVSVSPPVSQETRPDPAPTPQPQDHPVPHPPAGHSFPPTPATSPYAATVAYPPLPQQHGSYHMSTPGFSAPQSHYQWPAIQAYSPAGQPPELPMPQPAPQPFYEMYAPLPVAPAIPSAVGTAPMPQESTQPAQTFVAELQGSEPPEHGSNQATQTPKPASVIDAKPGTPGQEDPKPKAPGSLHEDALSSPQPALAASDSEGLIVVDKPGPPDHEGLIPFQPFGGQPPLLQPSAAIPHQTTSIIGQYPGPTGSPQPSAGHMQPQQPQQQRITSNSDAQPAEQQTCHQPQLASGGPNAPHLPPATYSDPKTTEAQPPYLQSFSTPEPPSTSASHWPVHPAPASPAVNPSPHSNPAPVAQPLADYFQPPAASSPPPPPPQSAAGLPPAPTPAYTSYPAHSTTPQVSSSQSHSPSPTPHAAQLLTPPGLPTPPYPPQQSSTFPPPSPQAPTPTSTYSPAAFPAKPPTLSSQTAPGLTAAGPSAIPSTPSITPSSSFPQPHHNFLAPPSQPSKPGRYSGASASFGEFANSVFSKDTVKWSKKTASRLGGAIKSAASSAHAAATNAQTAASHAAALQRQKSTVAAHTRASSAAHVNANASGPSSGFPQPALGGQQHQQHQQQQHQQQQQHHQQQHQIPQPQHGVPPIGYHQGIGGQAPHPSTQGQQHPQAWQPGSAVSPASSQPMPVPAATGPVMGGQAPFQAHQQLGMVAGQHNTWNAPNTPVAAAPQQQWGTGQGQHWIPQGPGVSAFGPGHNTQPQQGTVVPPPQPQGPGNQQPHTWTPTQAGTTSHPGAAVGSTGDQPLAGWQQTPPQWNGVAPQQHGWAPPSVPGQAVPYPYQQNPTTHQPQLPQSPQQPWAPFPAGYPPSFASPFPSGPGQPPPPAANTPQGTFHGVGAVPPQYPWQGQQPYAQPYAGQPPAHLAWGNGTGQAALHAVADQHPPATTNRGGPETEGGARSGAVDTSSMTPATPGAGAPPAATAAGGILGDGHAGTEGQDGCGATNTVVNTENGSPERDCKGESSAQAEGQKDGVNGGDNGQKGGDSLQEGGDNPVPESGSSQSTVKQAGTEPAGTQPPKP